jgi:hypothetical protein
MPLTNTSKQNPWLAITSKQNHGTVGAQFELPHRMECKNGCDKQVQVASLFSYALCGILSIFQSKPDKEE